MHIIATKLAFVSIALWVLATSADAQRIHPRCVTMKDQVGLHLRIGERRRHWAQARHQPQALVFETRRPAAGQ